MMKQKTMLTAGILAGLLALSCAGCGAQSAGQGSQSNAAHTSEPQQAPEESSATGTAQKAEQDSGIPQKSNGYLVSEPMGQQVEVDLDGDGKKDTLQVSGKESKQGEGENTWTEFVLNSIVINGKEMAEPNGVDPLSAYKVYLVTPEKDHYFLTDLDTTDGALEIALLDYGPSDDPVTWYFQYKDGALKTIGSLPGFPDDKESQRDGQGNVLAVGRLSLLQTWSAPFSFELKDGALVEVPQSQYEPIQPQDATVTLKQKLTLYTNPDQTAGTLTVEPSKEAVTFPATDNEHWVQMKTKDGTEGWIYLKDCSTIVSDGKMWEATDVFDNLFIAD